MSELGYLVIEYNQASKQPGLLDLPTLHLSRGPAEQERWDLIGEAVANGRGERYAIARVELVEEDETDA